jgi:hypothetical protein
MTDNINLNAENSTWVMGRLENDQHCSKHEDIELVTINITGF